MRAARSVSLVAVVAAVTAVGALAACSKSGSEGPTGAASSSVAAASTSAVASASAAASSLASAITKKPRRMMRRGGIAGSFLAAAAELPTLKPEQATKIDALEETLRGGASPAVPAPATEWKDLQAELVTEIKAGKLDAAKLDPLYAAVDKAAEARRAKEGAALDGLHATLDATQRKALADGLRARQKLHEEKRGAAAKPEDWRKRHVARVTEELGLDDAQQKQLEAAMAKAGPTQPELDALRDGQQKRRDALLTAFEGETFDATKLDLGPADKSAKGPAHRERDYLAQLLPILKPEQRDKLAERMSGGHGGMRGGGKIGPGGHAHGGRPGGGIFPGVESAIDDVFDEVEAAGGGEGGPAAPAPSASAAP